MIVISDGIDVSRERTAQRPVEFGFGTGNQEAQRRSVAIYSIFAPPAADVTQSLSFNGQGCLDKLSRETGGGLSSGNFGSSKF